MTHPTQSALRHQLDQALANTRIEGHVPTPEFLADVERVAAGQMTLEELRAASLARALAADHVAALKAPQSEVRHAARVR